MAKQVLTLCCLLFAAALFGQDKPNARIEILIDDENQLALVPEGTVIPHGLTVYGVREAPEIAGDDSDMVERPRAAARGHRRLERMVRTPLVFAYAPDRVFASHREKSRAAFEGKMRPRTHTGCWDPIVVYRSDSGCTGTQYTTQCIDPYPYYGGNYTLSFYDDVVPTGYPGGGLMNYTYADLSGAGGYYAASDTQTGFTTSSCWDDDYRSPSSTPQATVYSTGGIECFDSGAQPIFLYFELQISLYSTHAP